jgi:L-amino acid N-acyltransferase YncA
MEKRIRSVDVSDARAVQEIYAPFVTDSATSFEAVAPDRAEIERRIKAGRDQYPWLVFEREPEVLGYAYGSTHRTRHAYQWSVEVSVYVHPRAHRCGVGRALYTALFDVLRRQGYMNAYAGITLPNPGSVGLHESLGFLPIGVFERVGFKLDSWQDVAWLHLRLSDDRRPLHDPLPAVGVLQDPGVTAMFAVCADSVYGLPV